MSDLQHVGNVLFRKTNIQIDRAEPGMFLASRIRTQLYPDLAGEILVRNRNTSFGLRASGMFLYYSRCSMIVQFGSDKYLLCTLCTETVHLVAGCFLVHTQNILFDFEALGSFPLHISHNEFASA